MGLPAPLKFDAALLRQFNSRSGFTHRHEEEIVTRIAIAIAVLAALSATVEAAGSKKGGLAAISSDGTLERGVNVKKVKHVATGQYKVKFRRNVQDCYFFTTATELDVGQTGELTIIATPRTVLGRGRVVSVWTWKNYIDDTHDSDFFLRVAC
jgi:hypothetical protein